MSLVPSLLQAIVRVDGEALVMHVGEKPYVIAPSGQVDLAAKGLTLEAVRGIVAQLLPLDVMKALDELGAAQHELAPLDAFPGERFTVTVARGGDDVWAEIRRKHVGVAAPEAKAGVAPSERPAPTSPAIQDSVDQPDALELPGEDLLWPAHEPGTAPGLGAHESPTLPSPEAAEPSHILNGTARSEPLPVSRLDSRIEASFGEAGLWATPPDSGPARGSSQADAGGERVLEWTFEPAGRGLEHETLWASGPAEPHSAASLELAADLLLSTSRRPLVDRSQPVVDEDWEQPAVESAGSSRPGPAPATSEPPAPPVLVTAPTSAAPQPSLLSATFEPAALPPAAPAPPVSPFEAPPAVSTSEEREGQPLAGVAPAPAVVISETPIAPAPGVPGPSVASSFERPATDRPVAPSPKNESTPQSAVVLPIDRSASRSEASWHLPVELGPSTLERMIRFAAARGASALFLSSNTKPCARIDGEIQALEGTSTLGAGEIEAMLVAALSERHAVALRAGQPSELLWDIPEVGRVRGSIFTDHSGPGVVCRIVAARAPSVDQLELPREVRALTAEAEGLIIVSGPRAAGKSTLIASLVDAINRSRLDYVISFEREINIVHARHAAYVSQRELRSRADDSTSAARAALREDPDVLVFDELGSAGISEVALEAVQAGRLVIAGVRAPHLAGAIDRIVELHAAERRRYVLASLAQCVRAVVAQVLVKKSAGGRVAAREILLSSPIVQTVLAEGKTAQLAAALEGGRRQGMMPLNDALVGLVQSGGVDVREAYRHATDRTGLVDLLRRQGIDTSLLERLA